MTDDLDTQPTPLGRSLKLVDGDLEFADGDFKIIEGRENFLQAMRAIIETPYGSDVFSTNYGFDILNIFSQPVTLGIMKELIHLNIVKSLTFDDRVLEVKEVVFSDDPRFYEMQGQDNAEYLAQEARRVEIKGMRSWKAQVVVQTIEADDETFMVEGAGI